MSEATSRKIVEIEYLRAIAILITLFAHAPKLIILQPNPTMGWILERFSFTSGVDLFFAISGFVIMRSFALLMNAQGKDKGYFYNAKVFWTRRVF